MSAPKLFQPIQVGDITVSHRVVLAPLTRFRANDKHVPSPLAETYYTQRGSVPGTLLITEATFIAPQAGGFANVPGIWSNEQILAWKKITDAVHEKGSYIYLQLWALGRAAQPQQLQKEDPSLPYVSSSATPIPGKEPAPRALSIPEIHEYTQLYATAASNAVHKAGFDGVEIHGANGYLVDQFTQDTCNKRDDAYGGSVQKRARFALEVVDAVAKMVGEGKTGLRLSPWGTFQGMRMRDPVPTFGYLVSKLRELHPNLAYLHVVEPRVDGVTTLQSLRETTDSNDFIRTIWGRRIISAGGYTRELSLEVAEQKGDLIAFGRPFISNVGNEFKLSVPILINVFEFFKPDLPLRLLQNIALTPSDRKTYYVYGSLDPKGYTDYPLASDQVSAQEHSKL